MGEEKVGHIRFVHVLNLVISRVLLSVIPVYEGSVSLDGEVSFVQKSGVASGLACRHFPLHHQRISATEYDSLVILYTPMPILLTE